MQASRPEYSYDGSYTIRQYDKIVNIFNEKIPSVINKYSNKERHNCSIEYKENELEDLWISKIEEHYKKILASILSEAKFPKYTAQSIMLYSLFKGERKSKLFYYLMLEASIEVCKYLISKQEGNMKIESIIKLE